MHECPWLDDCWSLPPPLGKYVPYGNSTFYLEFSRPGVLPSRVPASLRRCQKIVHMARFLPALPVIGARISRQPTRSRHPRANPRARAARARTRQPLPKTRPASVQAASALHWPPTPDVGGGRGSVGQRSRRGSFPRHLFDDRIIGGLFRTLRNRVRAADGLAADSEKKSGLSRERHCAVVRVGLKYALDATLGMRGLQVGIPPILS